MSIVTRVVASAPGMRAILAGTAVRGRRVRAASRAILMSLVVLAAWPVGAGSGRVSAGDPQEVRRLSITEYRDKVKGGFAGQIIGNLFGIPWEGQFTTFSGPKTITFYKEVPSGAFSDDDTFVELVALHALEEHGIDATPRQLAAEWVDHIPRGAVACANFAALENFHRQIWPPDSGRPENNIYYLYIDAQIESDLYGLIAPGLPAAAQEYARRFGSLTNSSDGLLGAVYVATLYSLAFFERDPEKLVTQALAALPPESRYTQAIQAAVAAWKESPGDWRGARQAIARRFYQPGWGPNSGWVLADINGAMVTLALLYGGGDFERTVQIAVQAGFDNDCNAATAGGIVGTIVGFSALPRRWVEPLGEAYYNRTLRGFPQFLSIDDVSERMAKIGLKVVARYGGAEEAGAGELVIPVEPLPVAPYEPPVPEEDVVRHMARPWNPLWEVYGLGFDMGPGLRTEYAGRPHVFVTHPKSTKIPAELRARVSIPSQGRTVLEIGVTNYDQIADCDWVLKVFVDDQLLDERVIRREQGRMKWYDLSYDLTPWAGREVTIRLLNEANGWYYEAGYWSHAEVRTTPEGSGG